jgi:hypothetical protein
MGRKQLGGIVVDWVDNKNGSLGSMGVGLWTGLNWLRIESSDTLS